MNATPSPPYSMGDLPMPGGVAYHLGISAEQLAPAILLVGDPERVDMIADQFFEHREVRVSHRGLTTCTGTARETKQRVTVTTTGMGAPSTEVVLNEISALAEVDAATRTRRSARAANLTIIRVGTSGALQPATALGTAIISSHAVGLDSTAWFYAEGLTRDATARELAGTVQRELERALAPHHPALGAIHPYGAVADVTVVAALSQSARDLGVSHEVGATITASGFFAPQGRHISRVTPSVPDIDRLLARDSRFLNMDMETALVLHLCGAFGYRAGAVCVAAAHRELDTFSTDIASQVSNAGRVGLRALARVQR